ncbi:hypothetical protein [Affinibrenneria salicis]|uniref:hypothetical protein n=1 Tax=Affinibrenneria salicis TaxID=2590031 RepID=UPI00123D70E1|nr:hypothetical protein [Affinibrenneria salicis]
MKFAALRPGKALCSAIVYAGIPTARFKTVGLIIALAARERQLRAFAPGGPAAHIRDRGQKKALRIKQGLCIMFQARDVVVIGRAKTNDQ